MSVPNRQPGCADPGLGKRWRMADGWLFGVLLSQPALIRSREWQVSYLYLWLTLYAHHLLQSSSFIRHPAAGRAEDRAIGM